MKYQTVKEILLKNVMSKCCQSFTCSSRLSNLYIYYLCVKLTQLGKKN